MEGCIIPKLMKDGQGKRGSIKLFFQMVIFMVSSVDFFQKNWHYCSKWCLEIISSFKFFSYFSFQLREWISIHSGKILTLIIVGSFFYLWSYKFHFQLCPWRRIWEDWLNIYHPGDKWWFRYGISILVWRLEM